LTTARLLLRPFTSADVDPLYRIMEQRDVLRYFPSPIPPPYERVERLVQEQLEHWQEHGYGWWALEERRPGNASRRAGSVRRAGTFIGWAGLQYLPETDETEVGYLLGTAYWGRGLATEAARESVRFGFEDLDLPEIVGIVHPDHVASQRVLEKAGLSRVERAVYFNMDCYRYAVQRAAWDAHGV
jgi:RimJ/RimL family protein N-acetyltransferase